MTRTRTILVVALAAAVASVAAIVLTVAFTDGSCRAVAGGRCAGTEPVAGLIVSADGRTLGETVNCGGRLTARETANRVIVTFTATAVGAGGMSCARVPLTVTLHAPLNRRSVVDSTCDAPVALTPGDPYRLS
jgi:hypothetical protein